MHNTYYCTGNYLTFISIKFNNFDQPKKKKL